MKKIFSAILFLFISILGTTIFPGVAHAGQVLIHNPTNNPIACQGDGSGAIVVAPGTTVSLDPNDLPAKSINWVECERYRVGNLSLTPDTPDRYLSFNGQAQQTLSVLLYPYLPTTPDANFLPMVERIVNEFQAKNPQILLSAVATLSADYDTYTYENLPKLLGNDGFDVVELDTLMLSYLVEHHLIAPAPPEISTSDFWSVGLAASTYNNTLYGIPSWLCSFFLFARSHEIWNINSVTDLVNYLAQHANPGPRLITNFNDPWNLISFYLDGYADSFGVEQVPAALNKPINSQVIGNLLQMAEECEFNQINNCVNGYYYQDAYAAIQEFNLAGADSIIGFSEQSFYLILNDPRHLPLFATPTPYGPELSPLVFADTWVLNSSTCRTHPCQTAAIAFMQYMNSVETKLWITFSEDLASDAPPRRSLPPIQAFYKESKVKNDELYPQFEQVLNNLEHESANFPNSISEGKKNLMYWKLCQAFQAAKPNYLECYLAETRRARKMHRKVLGF